MLKMKRSAVDILFLLYILILTVIGLIMVFSASAPSALYQYGDSFFFVRKQLMWAIIGIGTMIGVMQIDYHIYKKLLPYILGINFVMLALVPIIGKVVKGARRWIAIGGLTIQPSEFSKLAIVIIFAVILASVKKNNQAVSVVTLGIILALNSILLMVQPHFSVTIIIVMTAVFMMLVAGFNLKYFFAGGILAAIAGAALVWFEPYRLKRITAFMDPFKDKLGDGWQIIQSLYAIGSGQLLGLGLGRSKQKFLYIPEPHNDFIYSIICEELGFIGAVCVLALFIALLWRGTKIAIKAPDTFGTLMVFGIIFYLGFQVVFNIAVATSSIPPTGVPLPFFSAGGSSFVFQMAAMGIALNVSRQSS